jgi:hypothetical protein
MTIKIGSPRWQELVREGIIRDGNRNWFLGDAALEIAPMGDTHASNGSGEKLAAYADEVGVAADSLRTYRDVSAAWPVANRFATVSWKVHQLLRTRQELIRDGMTVTQAHAALGHKGTGRTGPTSSTEDRAAAVRDLLTDPEVAAQVIEDKAARQTVGRAIGEHYRKAATDRTVRTERIANTDDVDRRTDALLWVNRLGEWAERGAREGDEILRHVGDLPAPEEHWLRGAIDRIEATVRAARRYLDLGRSEVDAELQNLIERES